MSKTSKALSIILTVASLALTLAVAGCNENSVPDTGAQVNQRRPIDPRRSRSPRYSGFGQHGPSFGYLDPARD